MPELKQYRKRFERLEAEQRRSQAHGHWSEINQYIAPHVGRFKEDRPNDLSKKQSSILDPTASRSLRVLSSGFMSGLTSPARPWFRLTTPDPDLAEFGPVKQYLALVEQRMAWIFARSNLYQVLPAAYRSIGAYGTAAIFAAPYADTLLRFFDVPIGSFYVSAGADGRVNTLYRERAYTVAQMVAEFGEDNVSDEVRRLFQRGELEEWVYVHHAVEPNTDRRDGSPFSADLPVRSAWWERDRAGQGKFLRQSGFHEFPMLVPRWETNGEDVYGHSPGMEVLPDVKQLQVETRFKLEAIQKIVRPPLQGPPELQSQPKVLVPNGITYTKSPVGLRPIYEVPPRLTEQLADIEDLRQRIRTGLFEDLFLMISQIDRSQITAFEIAERKEEKLLMLGPTLEQVNDDLLRPLIDRTFNEATRIDEEARAGNPTAPQILPEAPDDLQGVELRVEFISILHQAQKAVGTTAIERLAAYVLTNGQLMPGMIDKFDAEQSVDEMAEKLGVPPRVVRSDEEVEQIRQARQQQEQALQAAEMAPGLAKAAKDASETDTGDGESVLSRALSTVGAA